jgi:hypothetical protein
MSWLRITEADDNLLKFGEDGYVWFFADRCHKLPVSGWRVTAGRRGGNNHKCSIYRAVQCADHDGPRVPPNMVNFHDVASWPAADRAWLYNRRLALSNSARIGGRHYAAGCLYTSRLSSNCRLVIDDKVGDTPHANFILDVSPIGGETANRF